MFLRALIPNICIYSTVIENEGVSVITNESVSHFLMMYGTGCIKRRKSKNLP